MRRRDLIALAAGAAAATPLGARAQQKSMPVIGYVSIGSPELYAPFAAAFRRGLSETGYVEGQNVVIEYRWAEGRQDRLPALIADIVARKVDVIVPGGGGTGALTAKSATSHDVPAGKMISGIPAFDNREWLRSTAAFRRLGEMQRRLRELEKKLEELVGNKSGGKPPS